MAHSDGFVFFPFTESSDDEASGDEGLPDNDSDVSHETGQSSASLYSNCSNSDLLGCPSQNWEEEEAMEEDKDPDSKGDSKANGEEDMERGNESEEE